MLKILSFAALAFSVLMRPALSAAPVDPAPPDFFVVSSLLLFWSSKGQAFSVELTMLKSENVQALYECMGYPPAAFRMMKEFCVFETAIHILAGKPITYNVADWRAVTADGARHKLQTKTQWLALWSPLGVNSDWSILPPQQTLQPSDWGQGLTTVNLPRNTRFDLAYSWRDQGKSYHATVQGVQCAAR